MTPGPQSNQAALRRSQRELRKLSSQVARVERLYATYSFRGKDPIIARLKHACGRQSLQAISERSGVSVACLRSWFAPGGTRRPQFATVKAVANALGMTL